MKEQHENILEKLDSDVPLTNEEKKEIIDAIEDDDTITEEEKETIKNKIIANETLTEEEKEKVAEALNKKEIKKEQENEIAGKEESSNGNNVTIEQNLGIIVSEDEELPIDEDGDEYIAVEIEYEVEDSLGNKYIVKKTVIIKNPKGRRNNITDMINFGDLHLPNNVKVQNFKIKVSSDNEMSVDGEVTVKDVLDPMTQQKVNDTEILTIKGYVDSGTFSDYWTFEKRFLPRSLKFIDDSATFSDSWNVEYGIKSRKDLNFTDGLTAEDFCDIIVIAE